MRELQPGLWHWQATHPEWEESEPWDKNVSSFATDDGERLLLFDPLGVPSQIEERASDRETAIVLTSPWHERDAQGLVERLGAPHGDGGEAHLYAAGDRLPIGVQSFPGQKRNDLVLWVESHRAVVAGDTLADFGDGPQINPRWLSKDLTREQVVDGLRPLLELPVEHLLATHGGPFDRATLERALA
jgi:hypothetical protein